MKAAKLLLLDLDGVVVFEALPPFVPKREVLRLHQDIACSLKCLDIPVVILTHRSRAEAAVVLSSAGLSGDSFALLVAADDLLIQGCRQGRFIQLVRNGLQKSLALPLVENTFSIDRSNMAIIDDRIHNLTDLVGQGVGLGLHAPAGCDNEANHLITFNLADAWRVLLEWVPNEDKASVVELPEVRMPVAQWQETGLDTASASRHVFNTARRIGFALRNFRRRLLRARQAARASGPATQELLKRP